MLSLIEKKKCLYEDILNLNLIKYAFLSLLKKETVV
jgi:hypothetical protein